MRNFSWIFALAIVAGAFLIDSRDALPGVAQALPTPRGQLGGALPLETPTPSVGSVRPTPTPVLTECDGIEPVTRETIAAAAALMPLAPLPAPSGGAPVNVVQVTAAENAVRSILACANAGDASRRFAVYTNEGIARSLTAQGIAPEDAAVFIERPSDPLPEGFAAELAGPPEAVALAPDRIALRFTLVERNGVGDEHTRSYAAQLAEIGGEWRFVEVREAGG
jgi:hypothetical protein